MLIKGLIPAVMASVRGVYGLIISILITVGSKYFALHNLFHLAILVQVARKASFYDELFSGLLMDL
jgi:hypothetical protein